MTKKETPNELVLSKLAPTIGYFFGFKNKPYVAINGHALPYSIFCAFISNMFFGISTRSNSWETQYTNAMADHKHDLCLETNTILPSIDKCWDVTETFYDLNVSEEEGGPTNLIAKVKEIESHYADWYSGILT